MVPKPQRCERAKAWASLRTDGELSELESLLLEAHLKQCEPCREFAAVAERVASALRSAGVERPSRALATPLRRRRTGVRALQVAAAVVVVASAGVLAAFSGPSRSSAAAKPVAMVAGVDSADLLRTLRRPGLIDQAHPARRNRLTLAGEPV
jgi:predicted anti-sigma-YlaC factor YlaD